jgi:hypothetical protein
MSAAKVLIREASGDWAALLRRHLPDGAAIVELRQLDELWPRLREAPRAVVAMELQTDLGSAVLTELMRINHEFPQAVAVVLAQRNLREWEDICREAGAVAFIAGLRNIDDLVEIVRFRNGSEAEWTADDEQSPLEDRILTGLPWGN